MEITILCSSKSHPIWSRLERWIITHETFHDIRLIERREDLEGGDLLFLISCNEIIKKEDRDLFRKVLVIHASDLPEGRGWSPHIWQILEGREEIKVSLLEAEDGIDSGAIWKKQSLHIPKNALWNEINDLLFDTECELMDFAVKNFDTIKPAQQDQLAKPTFYRKRKPEDSQIDPHKTLAEQFDLIRVCDPERFPAYFEFRGRKFTIILEGD